MNANDTITLRITNEPGKILLNQVQGLLMFQGDNLAKWSERHGLRRQNARQYLLGLRNGKKAREWRQRIVEAARNSPRRINHEN